MEIAYVLLMGFCLDGTNTCPLDSLTMRHFREVKSIEICERYKENEIKERGSPPSNFEWTCVSNFTPLEGDIQRDAIEE